MNVSSSAAYECSVALAAGSTAAGYLYAGKRTRPVLSSYGATAAKTSYTAAAANASHSAATATAKASHSAAAKA